MTQNAEVDLKALLVLIEDWNAAKHIPDRWQKVDEKWRELYDEYVSKHS